MKILIVITNETITNKIFQIIILLSKINQMVEKLEIKLYYDLRIRAV